MMKTLALLLLSFLATGIHSQSYTSDPYQKPPTIKCTVEQVTETVDVCTPTFQDGCEKIPYQIAKIGETEFCYDSINTVCTESTDAIDSDVCTFDYARKEKDGSGKAASVSYDKKTVHLKSTICQPSYGYDSSYPSYAPNCKDIEQETAYIVPGLSPAEVPVHLEFPEAGKNCVKKTVNIPKVTCENKSEKKCISEAEVKIEAKKFKKCYPKAGKPSCQKVKLTLPHKVCKEVPYEAEMEHKHKHEHKEEEHKEHKEEEHKEEEHKEEKESQEKEGESEHKEEAKEHKEEEGEHKEKAEHKEKSEAKHVLGPVPVYKPEPEAQYYP